MNVSPNKILQTCSTLTLFKSVRKAASKERTMSGSHTHPCFTFPTVEFLLWFPAISQLEVFRQHRQALQHQPQKAPHRGCIKLTAEHVREGAGHLYELKHPFWFESGESGHFAGEGVSNAVRGVNYKYKSVSGRWGERSAGESTFSEWEEEEEENGWEREDDSW